MQAANARVFHIQTEEIKLPRSVWQQRLPFHDFGAYSETEGTMFLKVFQVYIIGPWQMPTATQRAQMAPAPVPIEDEVCCVVS